MSSQRHRKHLFGTIRYDGNLVADAALVEGKTKEARLLTIKRIEENWKNFLEDQKSIMNQYKHIQNNGICRRDDVRDAVASSMTDGTFDEPYTLWLNTKDHKWLKRYPKED